MVLINLSLQTNRVEKFINFKKIGKSIKNTAKKAGSTIKNTANKAGGAIKNTAKKVGSELEKVAPIPKKSYVPKTYPKASYGIGVGQIPLMIIMRPLKPGVKISRVNL
jgi:hypothetical protein